jgi:hypothetical protein
MHHCVIGQPLNGKDVDHINGNTLDNRMVNLRIVTHRQNMQNKRCHRNGKKSSRFVGVYWDKINWKWVAELKDCGQRLLFKRFDEEEKASEAYQEALAKLKLGGDTNGK